MQTAWDKGIGRTGGSSKRTKEAPDSVDANALGDIFGGITTVATITAPKTETVKTEQPKAEVKQETKVQEEVKETPKAETKVEETATADTEIDFSALANMNMADLNLGE